MKKRAKALAFLITGLVLCIAPLWCGLLGTVIGMISAFGKLAEADPSGSPEALAADISVALWTTVVGWGLCAIGLIPVIIAIVLFCKLAREKEQEEMRRPSSRMDSDS